MRVLPFIVAFLVLSQTAQADLRSNVSNTASSGVVLVLDDKGNELVSQNADRAFVPASVTKIVTAWLALEVLGSDYRFETPFYLDSNRMLYVRGSGDPFLVSEELELLADSLVEATGTEPITGLVIDTSYFPPDLRIPGIELTNEAYDALNSAFAANFNTIHAVRKGQSVRSAEKQTPITPLATSQFLERVPNGRRRINLDPKDPNVGVRYAGELLVAFIKKAGGKFEGEITISAVPKTLEPVYIHQQSRPLSEILSLLLLGSNNYIANQIFLEIGAFRLGGPVSLEKSLQVATEVFSKHDIDAAIQLKEGSGISPDNRFTTIGLAQVLRQFVPYADLLPRTRAGSRYKTGTIPGVRALAGYVNTSKYGLVPFVISLGGKTGKTRFRLLRTIERSLAGD